MKPEFENVLKAEKGIQASKPKFLVGASVFFVGVVIFLAFVGVPTNGLIFIAFLAVTSYALSVSGKQAKLNLEIVKAIHELQASVPSEEA